MSEALGSQYAYHDDWRSSDSISYLCHCAVLHFFVHVLAYHMTESDKMELQGENKLFLEFY